MAAIDAHSAAVNNTSAASVPGTGETCLYLGGCHGWFAIPDDQFGEFNRGTGCVAVLGLALLLVFGLIHFV
jgi:hypothetical protein